VTERSAEHPASLRFPDLPRLELDQLLAQLVERAQEVLSTQSRLRGLLHANQMIVGDLALPAVLRQIADAARDLAGARYAALGVIGPDGGLVEFVHTGMPADAVATIGHLPQGKGLLGALIEDPRPIRLDHITDDHRSSGFPAGHPPMDSFLGVPIRIRDEVFGNLYLAQSHRGAFTAEDEELVKALAATAAAAIDNARLYQVAQTRQRWLQASAAITPQLLDLDCPDPLRTIATTAGRVADAGIVLVIVPAEDGTAMRVQTAEGDHAADLLGLTVPTQGSLSGQVLATGTPLRTTDLPAACALPTTLDTGPVLLVPLRGNDQTHGVLAMTRPRAHTPFTDNDLDMAAGFTAQAAVALELAAARAEQQRTAMHHERDRIAADLHDHVIQRLFAIGLTLQSTATTGIPGPAADRIASAVRDLDTTISQIRSAIFTLNHATRPAESGLRGQILDVLTDVTPALGFTPTVSFTGPIEHAVTDTLAHDLLAVLREALTNTARHARATTATAHLVTDPTHLTLHVTDDGHGLDPDTTRRSGLANLHHRAERHGGSLTLAPAEPHGTRLTWTVPLH
jgi:signal transduction histidine kinase